MIIDIKKISWKTWLGISVIIFLLIIIFGKCNTAKKVEKIPVPIPDKTAIKERDAYRDTVEYYRKQIELSKKDKSESDKLLRKADVQLKGLIAKYNQAVQDANVPQIRETCDSIVLENTQLFEQIGQYQNDMNELVDYYELALKASDSAAIKSNYLLMAANKSNAKLTNDYNDLAKVYNKEVRKSKRNRGLNRVLAAAVLVAGGIAVMK